MDSSEGPAGEQNCIHRNLAPVPSLIRRVTVMGQGGAVCSDSLSATAVGNDPPVLCVSQEQSEVWTQVQHLLALTRHSGLEDGLPSLHVTPDFLWGGRCNGHTDQPSSYISSVTSSSKTKVFLPLQDHNPPDGYPRGTGTSPGSSGKSEHLVQTLGKYWAREACASLKQCPWALLRCPPLHSGSSQG